MKALGHIFLFFFAFTFFSCVEKNPESPAEALPDTPNDEVSLGASQEFWNRLVSLCGKSFEGELVSEPYNDDFTGKSLVMHVLSCEENQILIPFNVGENRSRTWILTQNNGRITLKHDHRHEDGTIDDITMYGGTSTSECSSEMVTFPADQETVKIIPEAFANIWWITVNDSLFSYNLRRVSGDRKFSVVFDLTQEVETPQPSWGWEEFGE